MTYIAFLRDSRRYFPIRSTRFQALLDYFGYDVRLRGKATWERYAVLLELAELRERLAAYGLASAIEIQSYMWVLSYLLGELPKLPRRKRRDVDLDEELRRRQRRASERERIGLQGERFVLESERARLRAAGRKDLEDRVDLVAADGEERAFDIRSFETDGRERHIEVKSTTRPRAFDMGFSLAEGERAHAEDDPHWRVYRVWDVDAAPVCEDIGNVVTQPQDGWSLTPANWAFRRS